MSSEIFKKIFRLSTLLISFELAYSPLIMAQDAASAQPQKTQSQGFGKTLLSTAMTIGQQYMNTMQQQNQQGAIDVEGHKRNLAALQPQEVDQAQIPLVFQGCVVYAAEQTNMVGMSCEEVLLEEQDLPPGNRRIDTGYFTAMYEIAKENAHKLNSLTKEGSARFTTQGKTCYDKKAQDFDGLMKAREEELEKVKNALTARVKAFKTASYKDLESIKQGNALLTGKPEKYLKDYDFESEFIGTKDPQNTCGSLFTSDHFQSNGKKIWASRN